MEKIATTTRLDAAEHALLRRAAAERRLRVTDAVREAIRLWLSMCGTPAQAQFANGRSEEIANHDQR